MTGDPSEKSKIVLHSLQYVFSPKAEKGTIEVEAPPGTSWTATSEAAWITITASSAGHGGTNGVVRFDVDANEGEPRRGAIRVADATMAIQQLAAAHWLSDLVLGNRNVPAIAQTGIEDLAKKLNELPPPARAAGYAALTALVGSVAAEATGIYESFPAVPHVFRGQDEDLRFVGHELEIILEFIARQATKG